MPKKLLALYFFVGLLCNIFALEPAHKWSWNYYFVHNMPQGLVNGRMLAGTITLPDKRMVKAQKFALPEKGALDLYKVVKPRPETLELTILTADFYADKAGKAVLGIGVDWRFKLYINGKAVYDTLKNGNGETGASANDHLVELEYKKGVNQIAIEAGGGRHAFEFAAALSDRVRAAIKYPPWVSFPDSNAATVTFSTIQPTPAGVEYRVQGSNSWKRIYNNLGGIIRRDKSVHAIRLENLLPDKVYEYRVVLIDELQRYKEFALPEIYTFKTLPAAGNKRPFKILLTSDLQVSAAARKIFMQSILQAPEAENIEFFGMLGDIVGVSNFDKLIIDEFVNPFRSLTGNKIPLVMVRGNHEMYGKEAHRYFEYFPAPKSPNTGYYMFRCGDVCFLVLDCGDNDGRTPGHPVRELWDFEPYMQMQKKWLEKAVESDMFQSARYRIVLAHGAPLGAKRQYLSIRLREVVDPLFASKNPKYKIHLWLSGHIHRVFRNIPGSDKCRTVYPVAKFSRKGEHPKIGKNYMYTVIAMGGSFRGQPQNLQLTSLLLEISENNIDVKHRDRNGKVFDHIKIAPDGSVQELFSAKYFKLDSF
ncbi:MAG: metallophosphoesterase [Lentisphaeria bacterium]|nr:metallophosphoesterase [Lentisphaeria bacterium]